MASVHPKQELEIRVRTAPSQIEVMLKIYYGGELNPHQSTATEQSITDLMLHGMIRPDADCSTEAYEVTPRGQAWVEMICSTPFPVPSRVWFDPRSNKPVERFDGQIVSQNL